MNLNFLRTYDIHAWDVLQGFSWLYAFHFIVVKTKQNKTIAATTTAMTKDRQSTQSKVNKPFWITCLVHFSPCAWCILHFMLALYLFVSIFSLHVRYFYLSLFLSLSLLLRFESNMYCITYIVNWGNLHFSFISLSLSLLWWCTIQVNAPI